MLNVQQIVQDITIDQLNVIIVIVSLNDIVIVPSSVLLEIVNRLKDHLAIVEVNVLLIVLENVILSSVDPR